MKCHVNEISDTESEDDEYMFSVEDVHAMGKKRIHAIMTIRKKNIEFQLDSGSSVNILHVNMYGKIMNDRRLAKLSKTNQRLITDNGPPLGANDFADFAQYYEFEHITSSPLYRQTNGKLENAVKVAKGIMAKSIASEKYPYLALLNWRNTPTEGLESSPAQLLYSRNLKFHRMYRKV